MAKAKLKIDQLAKLRQFSGGDDPAQFLATQWRQVVRALEQSYVQITDGNVNLAKEFYATDTNSYTVSNDLTFSTSEIVNRSGTVISSYIFRPLENGKFWIKANFTFKDDGTYTPGTWTSSFKIIDEAGTTLKTANFVYEVNLANGLMQFSTTSSCAVIGELNTNNGVKFNCVLSHSTLSNISFEIKKIG